MVHFYTSLGLVVAFLNVCAILSGDAHRSLLLFLVAVGIDGTDGFLARRADVRRWTPRFDGRKLDDITDYLNYAFLPILFAYQFGLIDRSLWWLAGIVLISAVYGFCQRDAKTEDHSFTGFPNYWNFVVMYLYWLRPPVAVTAVTLLVFAVLVWLPVPYISHRTRSLQVITLPLAAIFMLSLVAMVLQAAPDARLLYVSFTFPVYYALISLYFFLQRQRRPSRLS